MHPRPRPAAGPGDGDASTSRTSGGVLPVYVADDYEGFDAKPFPDLTDDELEHYIDANVAAVREVARGGVDAALANHLVMGPLILARAGAELRREDPRQRARPTRCARIRASCRTRARGWRARPACSSARATTPSCLWETLDDPELPAKTRLGPPGVDTELFAPAGSRGRAGEAALARRRHPGAGGGGPGPRRRGRSAAAIEHFADAEGPRVVFVGKLIVSKGVDLLLAAWPLVHRANPGRAAAARRLRRVPRRDRAPARRARGRRPRRRARDRRRRARARGRPPRRRCGCSGRFSTRRPRATPTPRAPRPGASRSAAASSTARSAASSPPPTRWSSRARSRSRSGWSPPRPPPPACCRSAPATRALLEVAEALGEAVDPPIARLLSFPLDEEAVPAIAERLNEWLGLDASAGRRPRRRCPPAPASCGAGSASRRGVIAASAGPLDELPPVARATDRRLHETRSRSTATRTSAPPPTSRARSSRRGWRPSGPRGR